MSERAPMREVEEGLSRRRLVVAAAMALALPALGCGARRRDEETARMIVTALADPAVLTVVGEAYLEEVPELDRDALLDRILTDLGRGARVASPEQMRSLLGELIHGELTEGRLVVVAGWRLAETEARICGLAALLAAEGTERS